MIFNIHSSDYSLLEENITRYRDQVKVSNALKRDWERAIYEKQQKKWREHVENHRLCGCERCSEHGFKLAREYSRGIQGTFYQNQGYNPSPEKTPDSARTPRTPDSARTPRTPDSASAPNVEMYASKYRPQVDSPVDPAFSYRARFESPPQQYTYSYQEDEPCYQQGSTPDYSNYQEQEPYYQQNTGDDHFNYHEAGPYYQQNGDAGYSNYMYQEAEPYYQQHATADYPERYYNWLPRSRTILPKRTQDMKLDHKQYKAAKYSAEHYNWT